MQPVILALVVHVVTFTLSATLPEILDRKPILDQVVTVDLVSLPEPAGPPQQKAPPQAEITKPEPVVEPEAAVKIPVEPQADSPPAEPVKPVSLKPIKRKVQKADPKKIAEEEARRKRELERQKALARAKQEEEKAKDAAQDARAALAEMIRRQGIQQTASASSRRSSGGRQVNSIVEQNYYAALYDRVQQFWVLPEMRQWDPGLETIVVATILRDGSIARTVVEKKSTDPFFDQFVMKTLRKAVPLPRFPKLMAQNSIEIGFRFRPGELVSM
ncbi:MAG TPA: cell envelope integrity protein TolA [Desulfobacteraceae bacterium]|nr:cell envelope integrity protein TolA [Desulfobacteraceae bacterium]